MRIGFDAKRIVKNPFGLGNYSRELIINLAQSFPKNDYFLFSATFPTDDILDLFSMFNVHWVHPKNSSPNWYWRTFGLKKELLELNLDIFHGLSNEIPVVNKNICTKLVCTIHDLIFIKYPEFYNLIDRKIYYQKVKYACKNADKIIVPSLQTKSDLIQYFKVNENKIEVIHLAYTSNSIDSNIDKKEPYFVIPGATNERKNVETTLKAIQSIDCRLFITGKIEQKYTQKLHKLVAQLNIKSKVEFTGILSKQELQKLYQNATGIIYISLYEGFGIPILEGFDLKVPVITSNVSSCKEVAKDAAICIHPTDTSALESALNSLLNDQEFINDLIEKGQERLNDFSPKKVYSQYNKLYNSLSN